MSEREPVTVVLSHYRRPGNFPSLVEAFTRQTYPVRLVLVDSSPNMAAKGSSLSQDTLGRFQTRLPLNKNMGPPSRFLGAFLAGGTSYTYFHDDDALPGQEVIEHYVRWAEQIGTFSVLGQVGRYFRLGRTAASCRCRKANVPRAADHLVRVDTTCRFHFLRTASLLGLWPCWYRLQQHLLGHNWSRDVLWQDDLLLNVAVQMHTQQPSYLVPATTLAQLSQAVSLPAPYPFCGRPGFYDTRNLFVQVARKCGWRRPVVTPQV